MKRTILQELQEAQEVLALFMKQEASVNSIEQAAQEMIDAIKGGGKIFSCGNGGSACDASHFAEEMTGLFREKRKSLPAIAISDVGHISCTANDLGFEHVFSRYLEGLANKEDCLLAISTSGNSDNVCNAAMVAKERGMVVIALTGKEGGRLAKLADVEIRVPHHGYSDRIQEIHIKVIHILILLIEEGCCNV